MVPWNTSRCHVWDGCGLSAANHNGGSDSFFLHPAPPEQTFGLPMRTAPRNPMAITIATFASEFDGPLCGHVQMRTLGLKLQTHIPKEL